MLQTVIDFLLAPVAVQRYDLILIIGVLTYTAGSLAFDLRK